MKVSVVLPCRNEEKSIRHCILQIGKALEGREHEIIVSDSSTDRSAEIAREMGAKVVECRKGYGNAYIEGFRHVGGEYVIMVDADSTYNFLEIPLLLKELDNGAELAIGSRLRGKIAKGAMKPLHRWIGNPILSLIFNILFGTRLSDTHSGFRAIRKKDLDRLRLSHHGMEFALEMLIKATKAGMSIREVPITYSKRSGKSKLRSFRDGVRHLSIMASYRLSKKKLL